MLASGDITYVLSPGETPARCVSYYVAPQVRFLCTCLIASSTALKYWEIHHAVFLNIFLSHIFSLHPHRPMSKTQMKQNDAKPSICSCYNLFPFVPKQCCCCIYLKTTVPLFIMKQNTGHLIKCKLILAVGASVSFVLTNKI